MIVPMIRRPRWLLRLFGCRPQTVLVWIDDTEVLIEHRCGERDCFTPLTLAHRIFHTYELEETPL